MKKLMKCTFAVVLCLTLLLGCAGNAAQTYCELGEKYLAEERYEQAVLAYTEAIAHDAESASAYAGRGDAYLALGNLDAATKDYEQAVRFDPKNPELYEKLGDAYIASGDSVKAQEIYAAGLEQTGDERFAAGVLNALDAKDIQEFFANHSVAFSTSYIYQTPEKVTDPDNMNYIFQKGLPINEYEFINVWMNYPIEKATSGEAAEAQRIAGDVGGSNLYAVDVIDNTRLQRKFDEIWGKGRINVRGFDAETGVYSFDYVQLSNDKIAICYWGLGGVNSMNQVLFAPVECTISGGTAVVKATLLYCNNISEFAVGLGEEDKYYDAVYDYAVMLKEGWSLNEPGNSMVYRGRLKEFGDWASAIQYTGINEADLQTVDMVFYSTADGVRLWGVSPAGTVSLPPDEMIATPLPPQVVPAALADETTVTVSADGGLRMRQGPGADYEYIQMIPNGTAIRCYGEQDGWRYVKYLGRFGWASADYCG